MIELWAPNAQRVRMRRPGHDDIDLCRAGKHDDDLRAGWWVAAIELADGDEYWFVLDDADEPVADPRSRRQPRGVHEASAHFEHSAFEWTDSAWTGRQLAGGLLYELHIGTFTAEGTLDAAIGRLEHLVDLGVTHVELLPVNGFNGTWNWGYDGVLWYTVQEEYGGPSAYQRFVDAAHGAGLAVIQDVVYNHLGPSGDHLPEFGPYFREGHRNTWGATIDLGRPEVRSYIVENALMWLRDYHVDGLRIDAVHALVDDGPVHILRELAEAADALSAHVGRPLSLIAESDLNDPTLILPREAGGYGLTAQWCDDWHHAVHVALTGEDGPLYADFTDPTALIKVWTQGHFHDGTHSSFRKRAHGHPIPADVPTWRLVTFAQNHDQIGNRAAGDRLAHSMSYGRQAVTAVVTMTSPFTPMLFMGEEWGASTPWQFFTSHPEDWLGDVVRTGRTEEFVWMGWDPAIVPDPQDPETFHRSKLDWAEREHDDHARLLALYRDLARLRRERAELTDPAFGALAAEAHGAADAGPDERVYRLSRGGVDVLVNLSAEPAEFSRVGALLLATDDRIGLDDGVVTLPAESAAIVETAAAGR